MEPYLPIQSVLDKCSGSSRPRRVRGGLAWTISFGSLWWLIRYNDGLWWFVTGLWWFHGILWYTIFGGLCWGKWWFWVWNIRIGLDEVTFQLLSNVFVEAFGFREYGIGVGEGWKERKKSSSKSLWQFPHVKVMPVRGCNRYRVTWSTFGYLHPGKLTWNLKITCLTRKSIFQTFIVWFHVEF